MSAHLSQRLLIAIEGPTVFEARQGRPVATRRRAVPWWRWERVVGATLKPPRERETSPRVLRLTHQGRGNGSDVVQGEGENEGES